VWYTVQEENSVSCHAIATARAAAAAAIGYSTSRPQLSVTTNAICPRLIVRKSLNPVSNVKLSLLLILSTKKLVFYVDNVSRSDEKSEFINSLSVRLEPCIEVRLRQQRDLEMESPICKAFRVCINSDDRQLFLDANKWPAYVALLDWLQL
jgi:hypothetical protein